MFLRLCCTFSVLLAAALLTACASVSRYDWVPSPNFNERRANYVVIHQTDSVNHERALTTLTNPAKNVSAHYLIAKDGRVTQMVEERHRAWHAGKSFWGGQADINSVSIGIELDHKGDAPFEAAQIQSLLSLLHGIRERNRISAANYLAHGDVAPGRKVDPNRHFPWKFLAQQGFGLWCDAEEYASVTPSANALADLQILGYDVKSPDEAMRAFRRHFRGTDSNDYLTEEEARMLSCLLAKRRLAGNSEAAGLSNPARTMSNGE